jgi:hypothetical protein
VIDENEPEELRKSRRLRTIHALNWFSWGLVVGITIWKLLTETKVTCP